MPGLPCEYPGAHIVLDYSLWAIDARLQDHQ